jgi:hypothetical protein
MMWLVMLAKMFARAVEASFHRGNTRGEGFGNFSVTATFLHQGKKRPILWPQLRERMPQRIELFGIDRAGRLGNVLMLLAERQKNTPEFLPPQLIDARIPREPEQPRLELRRRLQTINCPDHLDEDLLGEILDVITSTGHGVNESGNPMLVADDELALSGFVALLSPPNEIGQRSR